MENQKEKQTPENSFFQEALNTKPCFKCALQGDPGSGKTYTMAKIAIGLHKKIKSQKPVVLIDTERSHQWLIPLFKEANIKFLVRETKSLVDVRQAMKMCREGYSDILLIDSITHIHEKFMDAYKEKVNRQRLQFQDYAIVKPAWRKEFTEPLVNDDYHILFTGRIKDDYENELDEETGKREIFKSGRSMQAEKNIGYEPDLLLYMERVENILSKDKKDVHRQATVLKDKSSLTDGKTFIDPVFENFEPIIDYCLSNPAEKKPVEEGDNKELFKTEEDKRAYLKKKDILLEKIGNEMTKYAPGQSAEVKQKRIELSEKVFGTNSWTEVETFSLKTLEQGYDKLLRVIDLEKKAEEKATVGKDVKIKK